VYAGYVAAFLVLLLARGLFFYAIAERAASRMHNAMFARVLRAPMSLFTTTPLGALLSTFGADMDQVDEALQDNIMMAVIYLCILGTTIGVVVRVIPVFAAVAGGLAVSFVYFFRLYMRTSRALKSATGRAGAAVITHVSETLQGLTVILAYGAAARFSADSAARLDAAAAAQFNVDALQLWLSFRLDLIGCLLVLGTCLLAIASDPRLPAAAAGLAISNSFQILLFASVMVRTVADIDSSIACVERVVAVGAVEQEADLPLTAESCPRDGWPSRGEVDFSGVVMSYRPALPAILKGVTFNIRAGEKVGVAGRTGAGKSSLIMTLFRLVAVSGGAVRIDGVDVGTLNLGELRRRIAIIPQEPVMFKGTIRSNLDPFGEHADAALARALERAALPQLARDLDARVEAFGGNLSLGVQQLVCLARAMLNPSRVLLLDEATAALDLASDALVQRVLRTEFADRTVVTIAHRLDTIIDSDRVLIMDQGRVAEFAPPHELLASPDSIFSQLCRQTGGQYELLRAAAQRHHEMMLALQAKLADADDLAAREAGAAEAAAAAAALAGNVG
jgi:ABC-type multidrug transport system fused ATPase/permease subunit